LFPLEFERPEELLDPLLLEVLRELLTGRLVLTLLELRVFVERTLLDARLELVREKVLCVAARPELYLVDLRTLSEVVVLSVLLTLFTKVLWLGEAVVLKMLLRTFS
jgi:hypothetical protein